MERGTPYGSRRSSREQVTGGGGHTPGSASLPTGLDLGLSPIGPSPSGGTLHGDDGNLLEGWLKKRGTRIQAMWSERYFILRGDHLLYYLKQGDQDARGAYILDRSCVVSEVKQHTSSYEKKKLYVFRILWPEAIEYTETVPSQANIESGDSLGSTDRGGTSRQSSHKPSMGYNLGQGALSPQRSPAVLGTDVIFQRRQVLDGGQAPNIPDTPTAPSGPSPGGGGGGGSNSTTKIIRSVHNTRPVDVRRTSGAKSKDNSVKMATGATMVALAVSGIVVGAMTAGLGLVAPMVVAGVTAAAGGGATVYQAAHGAKVKQVSLVLASDVKETAEEWRAAIEAQIKFAQGFTQSKWFSMVGLDKRLNPLRKSRLTSKPTSATKLDDVDRWTRSTRWRPYSLYNGLRIYELYHAGKRRKSGLPCRRIQTIVRATPLETFIALVSIPCRTLNGVVDSMRLIETIDDHSDVIQVVLKPIFLWPTWTAPRDFCLVRYWRYDEDGTYIICYDSTVHRACPPTRGTVRADMHAVYTVSPKKNMRNVEFDDSPESLLTYILQVDPRGWMWSKMGYLDSFICEMLLQVLDVRDLLDTDRFMAVHIDTSEDTGVAGKEIQSGGPSSSTIATYKPTVPTEMWAEMDATTFVVRGPSYMEDRVKVPSDKAAFRLLAVDLFDLAEPIDNIAAHPNNRVSAAMKKGDCPPFVWVVQLQFPSTERHFGYVAYFAPEEPSIFEEDTPLNRVMKPFFFGESNTYRDNRFKLIPKIVEGNWVVRKSVGSTPAILGTKLKQNYYRGTNYFELDINIASSSVAAGVVRLAAGYAKTLVVDLGLVIQGEDPSELPERVVASWRIKFLDLTCAKAIE